MMEPARAIEIVEKLADGVDPFTDERFPSTSPYQQADTVRALHLALEGLAKLKRSTARKTGAGRPWSEEEEKDLLRKFDDKVDVEEIAKEQSGKITVAKVNIDQNPMAPSKYGVRGIPTLLIFKDGEEIGRQVGAMAKSKIEQWIEGAI